MSEAGSRRIATGTVKRQKEVEQYLAQGASRLGRADDSTTSPGHISEGRIYMSVYTRAHPGA